MKKAALILLVVVAVKCYGQSRLGYTEDKIKSEFSTKEWKDKLSKKGERIIYFDDTTQGHYMYYINDSSKLCDFCVYYPLTAALLNGFVEQYNKNYVIVSSKKWKCYMQGSEDIVVITLFTEDGWSYFSYWFEK